MTDVKNISIFIANKAILNVQSLRSWRLVRCTPPHLRFQVRPDKSGDLSRKLSEIGVNIRRLERPDVIAFFF